HILHGVLHLAPQRRVPRFARFTFQQWARENGVPDVPGTIPPSSAPGAQRGEVILWADTFNNYFHPGTGRAALEVLLDAGFDVRVPQTHLCCGRPLYDFGLLDKAKEYLEHVMTVLREPIDAGTPIVVLEPSCASVFRDELRNLFPLDERAARLRAQTFPLSEFLMRKAPGYEPPKLAAKVLLHGHCHHKAVLKFGDEESLLKKMGVELRVPDAGCCGMAGPFGFEKATYEVSQAVGERVLLPAVRNSSADTLVVSDGFSCREQIRYAAGREALHLAEILQLALKDKKTPNPAD
ncbi:MAG: (Fe-S)-binding protein, partial [Candidatus Acidiferrales bacterium]